MSAAMVVLVVVNAILAYLVMRTQGDLAFLRTCIDQLFQEHYGPKPPLNPAKARAAKSAYEMAGRAWSLPPPAPPPEEQPSPYSESSLPDELAAALEIEQRETYGASSKLTFARTEQDDRELELEDTYTSNLAIRIRELAGDEDAA